MAQPPDLPEIADGAEELARHLVFEAAPRRLPRFARTLLSDSDDRQPSYPVDWIEVIVLGDDR